MFKTSLLFIATPSVFGVKLTSAIDYGSIKMNDFQEQTVEALITAVEAFEKQTLNSLEMRKNAKRFSQDRFCREIKAFLYGIAPEVMRATEGR